MRHRIYLNGRPSWSDNEPGGYARVSGYGGTMATHSITLVTRAAPQQHHPITPESLARTKDRPRCGAPLFRVAGTCARNPGHRNDGHRSAESLAADNARRRAR